MRRNIVFAKNGWCCKRFLVLQRAADKKKQNGDRICFIKEFQQSYDTGTQDSMLLVSFYHAQISYQNEVSNPILNKDKEKKADDLKSNSVFSSRVWNSRMR